MLTIYTVFYTFSADYFEMGVPSKVNGAAKRPE